MTTSTLISAAIDYILANLGDVVGDPVKIAEGPYPLEDMQDEMVVIGDATMTTIGAAFAGEGGAMIRDEQSMLKIVAFCRREGGDDPVGDSRRRATEILDAVDNFLRLDKTLGGLMKFAWLHPHALEKVMSAEGGRSALIPAEVEMEGRI